MDKQTKLFFDWIAIILRESTSHSLLILEWREDAASVLIDSRSCLRVCLLKDVKLKEKVLGLPDIYHASGVGSNGTPSWSSTTSPTCSIFVNIG